MTNIAPLITDFLRKYLPIDRGYSSNTCETYAHSFRLLFSYVSERLCKRPSQLCLEDFSSDLVLAFLTHIERDRRNGAVTRNVRLGAIKDFMRYVEFHVPSALEQTRQVLAIPAKRHEQKLVKHLTINEIQAILNAPNLATRSGIRDRAMLHLCFACGLRVSELLSLQLANVSLRHPASIQVLGKGRRERCLPLWRESAIDLRAWMAVRGSVSAPELFVNAAGTAMTRAGFEYILTKHARAATEKLVGMKRRVISPYQLRHSCAVIMLRATRDIRKVALWLGHSDIRTTEIYLRVDPTDKLEAIEAILPPKLRRGKFRVQDALIASLLA
jgi:integrase/recombinase XerD